jgi:NAD-dependent DNA ligase
MSASLTDVKGIGPTSAQKLTANGITTAEALAAASPEQLAAVPGFGPLRAVKIIEDARQLFSADEAVSDIEGSADEIVVKKLQKDKSQKKKTKAKKKAKVKKKTGSKKQAEKKLKKKKKGKSLLVKGKKSKLKKKAKK